MGQGKTPQEHSEEICTSCKPKCSAFVAPGAGGVGELARVVLSDLLIRKFLFLKNCFWEKEMGCGREGYFSLTEVKEC